MLYFIHTIPACFVISQISSELTEVMRQVPHYGGPQAQISAS